MSLWQTTLISLLVRCNASLIQNGGHRHVLMELLSTRYHLKRHILEILEVTSGCEDTSRQLLDNCEAVSHQWIQWDFGHRMDNWIGSSKPA